MLANLKRRFLTPLLYNGHFLPSANPAPKRDRRPLWKRIQDEVIEGLGGADKVPAHLRRVAKLYSRLQAEIEQADLTGKKLSVMIGNAARLRRQMGLDVPLKRLPRVDRDQSYRDYLTDGDAVETQDTRSENDGSA
jgi:hypothetical protein